MVRKLKDVKPAICSFPTGESNRSTPSEDCDFIAASREAVPALCQALREAVELIDGIQHLPDWDKDKSWAKWDKLRIKARAFLEKWKG